MWLSTVSQLYGTETPLARSIAPWHVAMVVATVLFASELFAQAPVQKALPVVPLRPAQAARASRLPSLNDLTQVKLDQHQGELQLVMMLDSFRTEKRSGRVVKVRQEQRTRTIRDANGEEKQQTYTVQVPFAEEGEVDVKIPAGRKPVSKPASEFQFFDLNGNSLTIEAATEKLKSLQPAFLLDRFAGELPEIPELHRQALKEKCLVIVTEEIIRDLGNQAMPGEMLPARRFEIEPR